MSELIEQHKDELSGPQNYARKPLSGYAGKTLMQREIVALTAPHWPNSKVKALATAVAESKGSLGAWHDNKDVITDLAVNQVVRNVETYEPTTILNPKTGLVKLSLGETVTVPLTTEWIVSRDCGLYQINIPAHRMFTDLEDSLRTESMDEAVYMPVAKNNVQAAYNLWSNPWIRNGKQDYRRWQPWVAYTSGWAMFPEAWTWHQEDGNPVGPWVATGRYLHQAVRAIANWHLLIAKDMNAEEALAEAKRLADYWGITKGELLYSTRNAVYWKYPSQPTDPPSDGVGPRPKQNDGV